MDMMSMVTGILAMQAGNTQTQVATAITKSNADAAKSAAQTLLGAGTSPQANLGAGVGGNLDVTA
jgi:Putative motility protein